MHELPIDKNKIVALSKKAKHYNIFPIFLPRYFPGTQQHPISQLLGELVEDALAFLLIATNKEVEALLDSFPAGIKMLVEHTTGLKEERLRRIALYYIVVMVERIYFSFKDVINEDTKSSVVLEIYPELKNSFDKDGLLSINDDFILHDGVTFPRLLYHYILEYPALIDSASTGMPVENFPVSCRINSSGVRYPSELCGLAVL